MCEYTLFGASHADPEEFADIEPDMREVTCEYCGESGVWGEMKDDEYRNHYHEWCDEFTCSLCLKPAKRSEMHYDQADGLCNECHSIFGDNNSTFIENLKKLSGEFNSLVSKATAHASEK